ncbi:MAG TPA: hypothetical protein VKB92_02915 [Myxococcales bacterium]|nr:hypothetical protein [Myxococcales bacterium]
MSASSTQPAAPSLEDILWRAMDRFAEEPSVLDAEEFAVRVAAAFGGELPEETFVDRFVDGNPELARKVDMAEAIVRSTPSRLHVYEFDLSHLDYVVIEEEEQVLVVSDFGQFALANDRPAQQAIAAAVVRDRGGLERRAVDRASSEPRGYLVRQDGDLVVLDVQKLAAAIARLPVKQVSVPAVQRPQARLLPFEPRPRRLSQRSEMRALRENDRRASMPVPARSSTSGLEDGFIAGARPTTAAPAVFVLLPDGSLARPEMGSAARWHRMVSDWALRAGLLGSSSSGSVAVSGSRRFAVQAGKVTAVFTGGESRLSPGSVGAAAAARGDGVVAARAGFAPVRVLGDDELAQAVAAGAARIVAGWAAPAAAAGGLSDRYWVQPETVFAPTSEDRELVARADPSAGLDAPAGPQLLAPGEPLQLGQITGDPWTDWALQVGQSGEGAPLAARALRDRAVREIRLRGEPVVAFRAPDGTVLLNGERGPVRLAAADRIREGGSPDGAALGDAAPSGAMEGLRLRATRLAPRSGALPATALAALRTALERTAVAGGYKLPVSELAAAPDAIEVGHALPIGAGDPRRGAASLAAPASLAGDPGSKVARLLLSIPFPNPGEVHVGPDLADALTAYLSAPVVPAPARPVPELSVVPVAAAAIDPAYPRSGEAGALHARAVSHARRAQEELYSLPAFQAGAAESLSALPPLLHRAVVASGEFSPGPGAPMPGAIRRFALAGPFEPPELVAAPEAEPGPGRPLGPGEDEIVIPLPLWVQMGRGQASSTDHVMASPVARTSYAPPLGTYTLVRPADFRLLDAEDESLEATPGLVELSGPTGIRLRPRVQGGARAHSAGGKLVLGHVPLDDGSSLVGARGRIRVGEPLDAQAVAARRAAFEQSVPALRQVPLAGEVEDRALPSRPVLGALTAAEESDGIEGLPPGAWSGALPGSPGGYVPWTYSGELRRGATTAVGGVGLAPLPRPDVPALPTGMRFRFVAAPLWWSSALPDRSAEGEESAPASRAVRSGLRAANSAAAIWRSIFAAGAPGGDLSGGMDRGHDEPARALSGVERRMDVLVSLGLVGGGAAAAAPAAGARGPETVYVAMDEQGRAGTATAGQVRRTNALARSVEMRIVAAIPPSPPPLQSMGGTASPVQAPPVLARQRHAPGGEHKAAEENVSQSRIEGSVDAIAQRIYHRIRQRIASDRERFGG